MRAAWISLGLETNLTQAAFWLCACNLLATVLSAQCPNPVSLIPDQTVTSGATGAYSNVSLRAANYAVNGSASVAFVSGQCVELAPNFHATAGTAPTTFHTWVDRLPTVSPASPPNGSGMSQQFTWTASSPSGYGYLGGFWAEIGNAFTVSSVNSCLIFYYSNVLWLADNSGNFSGANSVPVGSPGTIANSQCSIYGGGSSVHTSGNQLALTVSVTFQPAYAGLHNQYLLVFDQVGLSSEVQQVGTWNIDPGQVTISGHMTALSYPLVGAAVALSGSSSAATITDSSGAYSFLQTAGGNYTITPSAGSLVFAPPSFSWNNLTANRTVDFTALPSDYPDGSGPANISNSFTASDPVLTCDDISGEWEDADQSGNSISWNLTQAGTSVTGQMSYYSIRSGVNCGLVTYDVTGSYDSNSASFSLSATIHGSPYDSCSLPVASQETETVILAGRACGTGSGQFNINTSSSTATEGLSRQAPSLSSQPERNNLISTGANRTRMATSEATAQPPAAQGSSSWTTISPRFSVQYSSYIPVDHIAGPTACGAALPFGLKTYKGDAFRGTYRTTESLLVVPGAQKYTPVFARGGPTRNYQIPSSPANGPNLSSTPTGDFWRDPYTGADEDERRFDCHLWNDKGEADNSAMQGVGVTFGNPTTQVNLYGFGQDPLEPRLPGSGIKWNLVVSLDTTDPAHPTAWVSGGTRTCYPAHIVKVNGVKVFEVLPTFNNTAYLLSCLDVPGVAVTPSQPTVVPAH